MIQAQAVDTEDGGNAPAVEIRVHADPTQLPVVRGIAGALAAQNNFDVDVLADLRLAVDEACTQLIRRALPGSQLICIFHIDEHRIHFAGSTTTENASATPDRGFGWHVLRTLTDEVSMHSASSPLRGSTTTIEFVKQVGGAQE
ncbi:ATP-binding protein [Antrihabitans cavernicola]|uniref:ATP-binding protein n=1 Tax=Antrihabitans cavernicola TaxID=2495913 RepID=A0A5A7S5I0_9NOCA|nr:ATP-binding protein [Spelaeibacter cavernicola]KAA0019461.1 ATP-binding protein [Spelaeibacter cavernicola]